MQDTLFVFPAKLTQDPSGRWLVRFPDLPEALTDGASVEEALAEAADCLSEALMSRIADGEPIPHPSPVRRGAYRVAPDAAVALKAALHTATSERRVSTAELARRMRIDHKEARRMLDARHPTKVPRLAAALRALGVGVAINVYADDRPRRSRAARS